MKRNITLELTKLEGDLRRWNTRLVRAVNAIQKLEQRKRRLLKQTAVARMTAPPGQMTPNQVEAIAGVAQAVDDQLGKVASPGVETDHISDLDLPAFLDRRNPDGIRKAAREMQEKADAQLVDKLKAKRASQVEADKHKMPLTGKAAIDYLKVTPKRKAKG